MDELDLLAFDYKCPQKRFAPAHRLYKKPEPVPKPTEQVAANVAGARSDAELAQFLAENKKDTVQPRSAAAMLPVSRLQNETYEAKHCLVAGIFSDPTVRQMSNIGAAGHIPSGLQVVVNFGSTWCHSCHNMFPHFYRLTSQFPGFKYVVAQIDYMHEAAQSVHYTPTFRFVRGGKTVDQFYGASHQQLRDHLWLHADAE